MGRYFDTADSEVVRLWSRMLEREVKAPSVLHELMRLGFLHQPAFTAPPELGQEFADRCAQAFKVIEEARSADVSGSG